MQSASGPTKCVLLVGTFPPPIHGAALVNAGMAETLTGLGLPIETINLSPRNLAPGPRYLFVRAFAVVRGLTRVLLVCLSGRAHSMYIGLSGGRGLLVDGLFASLAWAFRLSAVLHHHSFRYLHRHSMLAAAVFRIAGSGATHIVLCDRMRSLLEQGYSVSRCLTVSNAGFLQPPEPARATKHDAQCIRIGFLGNISPEKGIDEFLKVARILRNEKRRFSGAIAGPFHSSSVESAVTAEVSRNSDLTYVGPVFGESKDAFLSQLDVLLFPSSYVHEAEPLTVLEAMSYGVPVIAWERGCIPHLLSKGGGDLIRAEEDFADLAVKRLQVWMVSRGALAIASTQARARFMELRASSVRAISGLAAGLSGKPA